MKIDGHFDRKKTRKRREQAYLPQLPLTEVNRLLSHDEEISQVRETNVEVGRFVNETLHEIRRLNAQIGAQGEEAIYEIGKTAPNLEFAKYRMENVRASSTLISTRLDFYDLANNPGLIVAENQRATVVYKSFHKIRHCLQLQAKERKVKFEFNGTTRTAIRAYRVFDLLPYVVLENALKYSPKEGTIEVTFAESQKSLEVTVTSLGPRVQPHELVRLTDKEFRGEFAGKSTPSGSGIGLFFAKQICEVHDVKMNFLSSDVTKVTLNDIPYSDFTVAFQIPKNT